MVWRGKEEMIRRGMRNVLMKGLELVSLTFDIAKTVPISDLPTIKHDDDRNILEFYKPQLLIAAFPLVNINRIHCFLATDQ